MFNFNTTLDDPFLLNEIEKLNMSNNIFNFKQTGTLVNCIKIDKSQTTYDSSYLIDSNTINITGKRPSGFVINLNCQPIVTIASITNNKIYFGVDGGLNPGSYIPFTGSGGYAMVAQTVSNNICIDKYVNWINIYTNTTNITSGTNTLSITGATFQTDLKIGQKILVLGQVRTIQTIPSQTSLTVNTNWTSSATGATVYFEKASIQTWLNQITGSRNNGVINNYVSSIGG